MLKVSIITACYNRQDTVEDTIKSVISQDYTNIEYIVIDGKSSDKTLDIIKKYSNKITKIVSEKDEGMYYALNKGIQFATGDIIGFLHADDFYPDNTVISKIVEIFTEKKVDSIYSDLQYVDPLNKDKIFRNWKSEKYKEGMFLKGWMPPHPTFFAKKSCYEKYGIFNTTFKSAADYELMLRFIHKYKISTAYIPEVLVKLRTGGKSNVTLLNRIKANKEDRMAWQINNLKPHFYTLSFKPLSKIFQFVR